MAHLSDRTSERDSESEMEIGEKTRFKFEVRSKTSFILFVVRRISSFTFQSVLSWPKMNYFSHEIDSFSTSIRFSSFVSSQFLSILLSPKWQLPI